jgi:hypothetical protein
MKKQQFNIYLPTDLIREVKHEAIDLDVSLSKFVEDTLSARLRVPESSADLHTRTERPPLSLLPIVYVTDMYRSIRFYRALGCSVLSKGGMWTQLELGGRHLALHRVEHGSGPSNRMALALSAHRPLENIREELQSGGITPAGDILDEAFGRSLLIYDPDGLPIQINEHDPDLYGA